MCLSDLNRKIYNVLRGLEDLDDEILFGSERSSYEELLKDETRLLKKLEALYLEVFKLILDDYPYFPLICQIECKNADIDDR